MNAPTLCILLKAPRAGDVKTRLGRDVGVERAAAIYRRLVEWQFSRVPPGWPVEIHFAPADAGEIMRLWLAPHLAPGANFFPQSDGDLGARLKVTVAGALARGAASVILIGGDCPDLDAARLASAADSLAGDEVVLIPALDGGYVLLGLKAARPFLFEDIAWSTTEVLDQTLAKAAQHGITCKLLESLEDVDDFSSWNRAIARHPSLGPWPFASRAGTGQIRDSGE